MLRVPNSFLVVYLAVEGECVLVEFDGLNEVAFLEDRYPGLSSGKEGFGFIKFSIAYIE
ncbi:hypothetical protein ES703_92546 [subsurface metagenome]